MTEMNIKTLEDVQTDAGQGPETGQKRAELHLKTESMEIGHSEAYNLVTQAIKQGYDAVAVVDQAIVWPFGEAYRAARRYEMGNRQKKIKVIYGVQVHMIKDDNLGGEIYDTVILVKNQGGLKNLYKILSLSYTEYFKEIPLTPKRLLTEYREGLLLASPWASGEVYHEKSAAFNKKAMEFYDYFEISAGSLDITMRKRPHWEELASFADRSNKPIVAVGGAGNLPSTGEMLEKFECLGKDIAYKLVISNPGMITRIIEEIQPFPDGKMIPVIDGAEKEMVEVCNIRIREIYGGNLTDRVKERLNKELADIMRNNFTGCYMAGRKLVKKIREMGCHTGYKGAVGASLVAYLLGISEIDPVENNIPVETFAGLGGDREPYIDITIDGKYLLDFYKYAEEIFGKDKVFGRGFPTGDAFGSIIVLPPDREIYEFTPVRYLDNEKDKGILITSGGYRHLHDSLFNIHVSAAGSLSMVRRLEDLTGIDAKNIPLDDKKLLDRLINTDSLGIPEFGSKFVRSMIRIAEPKTFTDFTKIFAFSHSYGAWENNAENLIGQGTATINGVVSARDGLMLYLAEKGIDHPTAYAIMEGVRKGRGISEEFASIMVKANIPEWYIASCNKIKYLSHKAHAIMGTVTAFRIAWFKAHHAREFYEAFMDVYDDTGVRGYGHSEIQRLITDIEGKIQKAIEEQPARYDDLPVIPEHYLEFDEPLQRLELLRVRYEMLEASSKGQ